MRNFANPAFRMGVGRHGRRMRMERLDSDQGEIEAQNKPGEDARKRRHSRICSK